MESNIRLVSIRLRWTVVILTFAALAYLLISYLVMDRLLVNAGGHPHFFTLWEESPEQRLLLTVGQLPSLLLAIGLVYWVWRLFGCYAQGDYFGDDSQRCYLWLVWLYGLLIPAGILTSLWVGWLQYRVSEKFTLAISLDLSKLFSLFVLISVLYILRAAKRIEQENQEFV